MQTSLMLRSLKQWYGDTLCASDGEIGHVEDFYVDDQTWAVRYMIVDTGAWLKVTKEAILSAPEYEVPAWAYNDAQSIAD